MSNGTKLKNIYHVSDVHIKMDLHLDIIHAFSELVKTITATRETSGTILVIAGDVFEYKTHMSQHDSQCFSDIIKMLTSAKITTIIMPGNHDYERTNGLDLITPLLMNRDGTPIFENIYCYAKSGIYKHMGVEFHIISPIDEIIPPIEKNTVKKIAVIHEIITDSKYSLNPQVSPATGKRFNANNLSQYDFALLGDIHMYQTFGSKSKPHTIAYSGSLVQKDRGEGLIHGYIKWDISDGSHKFIQIPLIRAYVPLEIKNNLFDLNSMPNLIAKEVIITHSACTQEFVNKVYETVVKKYGLSSRIYLKDSNPKVSSNNNPGSEIVVIGGEEITRNNLNFNTMDNQLHLISAYLKQIGKPDFIEPIHMVHRAHAKEIVLVKKWKLEWMRWSNISCFGEDNFINFNDIKGIGSILGKNKTGKSSVITALMYCLTYKTGRITSTTIDDLVNKNFPDENSVIECGISVGKTQYLIHNNLNEPSKSHILMDGLQLYTDSEDNKLPKILKKITGHVDLISAISIKIQDITSIADQKDTTLIKTLDKVLGLSVLSETRTKISQEIKNIDITLNAIKIGITPIENLEKQIIKNNEELFTLISSNTKISESINNLNASRDELIKLIPDKCTTDIVKAQIKSVENQLAELEKSTRLKKEDKIKPSEFTKFTNSAASLKEKLIEAENIENNLLRLGITIPEPVSLEALPGENDTVESLELQIKEFNKKVIGDDTLDGAPQENAITNEIEKLKQLYFKLYEKEFDTVPKNELILAYHKIYKDETDNQDDVIIDFTNFEILHVNEKMLPYIDNEIIKSYYDKVRIGKKMELLDDEIKSKQMQLYDVQKKYANIKYSESCECCAENKNIINELSSIKYLEQELQSMINKNEEIKINNVQVIKDINNYNKIKNARIKNDTNKNFNIYKHNMLVEKINKLENILAKIHSNQYRNKIEQLKSMIKYLKYPEKKEKYDNHKQKIDDIANKIAEIKSELETINNRIKHYELYKSILHLKIIAEKIPLLDTINADIKAFNNEREVIIKNIATIDENNNQNRENIKQQLLKQKEYEELTTKKTIYDEYYIMLGETKLPFSVMKNSIDNIISDVNNILHEICNFQIAIEIIETKMANNEFRSKTRILIEDYFGNNKITINSHMGSGFQKFVIDLAFRISFINNISSLPKFLIIDEGFGSLDEANRTLAKDALCKIVYDKKYLDFMIIISHQNEFNNISKSNIIIEQLGELKKYSKVSFGTPVKQIKCIGKQLPPENIVKSNKDNELTPDELAFEAEQFSTDEKSNPKKVVCLSCRTSLQWSDKHSTRLASFKRHCNSSIKHKTNIKINYRKQLKK